MKRPSRRSGIVHARGYRHRSSVCGVYSPEITIKAPAVRQVEHGDDNVVRLTMTRPQRFNPLRFAEGWGGVTCKRCASKRRVLEANGFVYPAQLIDHSKKESA